MEVRIAKMQPERRQPSRGVRPSQIGLVPEEEHGIRTKSQEFYRGSKRGHPQRNDDPKFDEVYGGSCIRNRRSKAQDERLARHH